MKYVLIVILTIAAGIRLKKEIDKYMLTDTERLVAVVRNIARWDFSVNPKYPLEKDEAEVITKELELIAGQRMLNEYMEKVKNDSNKDA